MKKLLVLFVCLLASLIFSFAVQAPAADEQLNPKGDCAQSYQPQYPNAGLPGCKTALCGHCSFMPVPYFCNCEFTDSQGKVPAYTDSNNKFLYKTCLGVHDSQALPASIDCCYPGNRCKVDNNGEGIIADNAADATFCTPTSDVSCAEYLQDPCYIRRGYCSDTQCPGAQGFDTYTRQEFYDKNGEWPCTFNSGATTYKFCCKPNIKYDATNYPAYTGGDTTVCGFLGTPCCDTGCGFLDPTAPASTKLTCCKMPSQINPSCQIVCEAGSGIIKDYKESDPLGEKVPITFSLLDLYGTTTEVKITKDAQGNTVITLDDGTPLTPPLDTKDDGNRHIMESLDSTNLIEYFEGKVDAGGTDTTGDWKADVKKFSNNFNTRYGQIVETPYGTYMLVIRKNDQIFCVQNYLECTWWVNTAEINTDYLTNQNKKIMPYNPVLGLDFLVTTFDDKNVADAYTYWRDNDMITAQELLDKASVDNSQTALLNAMKKIYHDMDIGKSVMWEGEEYVFFAKKVNKATVLGGPDLDLDGWWIKKTDLTNQYECYKSASSNVYPSDHLVAVNIHIYIWPCLDAQDEVPFTIFEDLLSKDMLINNNAMLEMVGGTAPEPEPAPSAQELAIIQAYEDNELGAKVTFTGYQGNMLVDVTYTFFAKKMEAYYPKGGWWIANSNLDPCYSAVGSTFVNYDYTGEPPFVYWLYKCTSSVGGPLNVWDYYKYTLLPQGSLKTQEEMLALAKG